MWHTVGAGAGNQTVCWGARTEVVDVAVVRGAHDQVGGDRKADGQQLRAVLLAGVVLQQEAGQRACTGGNFKPVTHQVCVGCQASAHRLRHISRGRMEPLAADAGHVHSSCAHR